MAAGFNPSNGLILRTDLHRLFDSGLMIIRLDGTVTFAEGVEDASYKKLEGAAVKSDADLANLANRESY